MFCTPQSLPAACLPHSSFIPAYIRRGDTAPVFTWAFQTVFPAVRARLARRGIGQAAATELFTDAVLDFIAGFQKNTTLDGQNPAGYLWRICRNKFANQYRARSRALDVAAMEHWYGAQPDPDTALMAEALQARLGRLASSYREIVRLYYFEGMSCAEIALQLGSTPESVKERKYRAIKKLRAFFI